MEEITRDVKSIILSRLPTLNAVRTCILCKDWEYAWEFVTALYFEDNVNVRDFRLFVNLVLSRIFEPSVTRFTLVLEKNYSSADIKQWIDAALRCNLEFMCIDVMNTDFECSEHIFCCPSIVDLSVSAPLYFTIPISVRLMWLKRLELRNIRFGVSEDSGAKQVEIYVPSLEILTIQHCVFFFVDSVIFRAPSLRYSSVGTGLLVRQPSCCTITLCCPRLTKFCLLDNVDAIKIAGNPIIAVADIRLSIKCFLRISPLARLALAKLIKSLEFVEVLSLSTDVLEVLKSEGQDLEFIFSSLKELWLEWKFLSHGALCFLKTNLLQSPLSLASLKMVSISGFLGRKKENRFVQHILKTAPMLETFNIKFHYSVVKDEVDDLIAALLAYEHTSPFAVIQFLFERQT